LTFAALFGLLAAPPAAFGDRLVGGRPVSEAIAAFVAFAFVGPISAVVSALITAALAHFWLFVLCGRHATFRETLACAGYAAGAAVFGIIPVVGIVVQNVWYLVVFVIGLKHVQKIGALRATFVVLAGPMSLVLLALGLRAGAVEAFKIPSAGMLPSLEINDHIFVSKLPYGPFVPFTKTRLYTRLPPERGDPIVFEFPDPNSSNPRQDFIQRVVAIEGDTLEMDQGHPIINGWRVPSCNAGTFEYQDEGGRKSGELDLEFLGGAAYLTLYEGESFEARQGPYRVARGEVWVLGDNRNNSADSRTWFAGKGGGVPFALIKGRAGLIWMAFDADGGISYQRLFLDLRGRPRAPSGATPEVVKGIEKCLAARPPRAETSPPTGSAT
jgi:signal peptidase I